MYNNILFENVDGFMGSMNQRELLYNLGKTIQNGAEIGSFKGLSSCIVGKGMLDSNVKGKKYYCIDTFKAENIELENEYTFNEFSDNIKRFGIEDFIIPIKFLSTDKEALDTFKRESLDFIYVDGSHETQDVEKDISLYAPFVKQGGIIMFHDYTWPSVRNAVNNVEVESGIFPVLIEDDYAVYRKL